MNEELFLDIYKPATTEDTTSIRPIILIVHDGGFTKGGLGHIHITELATEYSKRGYIAIPITYRKEEHPLGLDITPAILFDSKIRFNKAVLRAAQDIKEAVKFLKYTVDVQGNPYQIDTSNITIYGASAGGIAALTAVYLDENDNLDSDWTEAINQVDGLENENSQYRNYSFSSTIKNLIIDSGALFDIDWIDNQPAINIMAFHYEQDGVVPIDANYLMFGLANAPLWGMYHGAKSIVNKLVSKGVKSNLFLAPDLNHVFSINSIEVLVDRTMAFLHDVGCSDLSDPFYTLNYRALNGGQVYDDIIQTVPHGVQSYAVTAVPDMGLQFVKWTDGNMQNPRIENTVQEDIAAQAIFDSLLHTLKYTAGNNGVIEGDTIQIVPDLFNATPVKVIPNPGYKFVMWSDSLENNPRWDQSVKNDLDVSVFFDTIYYELKYSSDDNGFLSGDSIQSVAYNSNGTAVEAIPNDGYNFLKWNDERTDNPRIDSNVNKNVDVKAFFTEKIFYTLKYNSAVNGSLEGDTIQTVERFYDGTPITAIPNAGYTFLKWGDGILDNPRTDKNVTRNISIKAFFKKVNYYTLVYTSGDHGYLLGDSIQTVEEFADGASIEAIPESGYLFSKWSDGVTDNPRTDRDVQGDIAVTAEFEKDMIYYTLKYFSGEGGYLQGDSVQTIEEGQDGNAVTAMASNGYIFTTWSDGVTDNPRTDEKVYQDIEVIATFGIVTGVADHKEIELILYPNPSSGILNVSMIDKKDYKYSIIDLNGSQVIKGSLYDNVNTIDISMLSPSLYFIVFTDPHGDISTYKLVKE